MNPQCLRVVIDFSSLLEPSNIFRLDSDWYFRCMMDEMVTDVGWSLGVEIITEGSDLCLAL